MNNTKITTDEHGADLWWECDCDRHNDRWHWMGACTGPDMTKNHQMMEDHRLWLMEMIATGQTLSHDEEDE